VGTLIDTSVLVDAERGKLEVDAVLKRDIEFSVSAVTASELLHGVHRAPDGRRRRMREVFVEQLLARVPVVPFDLVAARVHSRIWAELAARGVAVGERDLLIGATALAHGHGVWTRDLRSFASIPDLTIVTW